MLISWVSWEIAPQFVIVIINSRSLIYYHYNYLNESN